jgi:hypothetical protein
VRPSRLEDALVAWTTRAELEALEPDERAAALVDLRAAIDARLAARTEREAFWLEVQAIVTELKAAGHDMWSHDYDGGARSLWGYDYMNLERAGLLQLQFTFGGTCSTYWRGEDSRLGVDDDEG